MEHQTGDLRVDPELRAFVADELLPRVGITPDRFWSTLAGLHERFAPRAAQLLARRDELQAQLDAWHREHGAPAEDDLDGYVQFLTEIGYLLPQEEPRISVTGVDREIAEVAGPQLVVPATVPRYALNAANARWGSLFDALYGTDALPLDHELARGYDERRGAQVIAEADRLLDAYFPLQGASHADVTAYRLDGERWPRRPPTGPSGWPTRSSSSGTAAIRVRRRPCCCAGNGLHAELSVDGASRVGRQHHAEVADVVLESAVTTIVDLEDSVATVDGPDKVGAYRSWLGLMTGELEASFPKGGETVTRTVNGDRIYTAPDGSELVLPGRSLLLVRNVGHHMRLDAVTTADGEPLLEECLDILVSTIAALHDLRGLGRYSNSRTGSLYVVKPKMHGPDEVGLSVDLFTAVEEALELPPTTIKIGIMDEERRTSTNLEACIARAADRVIFVNTGFLDRTGDEIHSDFEAGPVVRKDDEKTTTWLQAYEARNVDVALRAGFAGNAQIGKGMWAQPAGMRAMLDTKGAPEGRREHRLGALADGGDPARAALPGDRRQGGPAGAGVVAPDGPAQAARRAGAARRRRRAPRRGEAPRARDERAVDLVLRDDPAGHHPGPLADAVSGVDIGFHAEIPADYRGSGTVRGRRRSSRAARARPTIRRAPAPGPRTARRRSGPRARSSPSIPGNTNATFPPVSSSPSRPNHIPPRPVHGAPRSTTRFARSSRSGVGSTIASRQLPLFHRDGPRTPTTPGPRPGCRQRGPGRRRRPIHRIGRRPSSRGPRRGPVGADHDVGADPAEPERADAGDTRSGSSPSSAADDTETGSWRAPRCGSSQCRLGGRTP